MLPCARGGGAGASVRNGGGRKPTDVAVAAKDEANLLRQRGEGAVMERTRQGWVKDESMKAKGWEG